MTKRTSLWVAVPGIGVVGTWWCSPWRSCHTPSLIYKVWHSNHWKLRGNLEWGVNFIFHKYDTVLYCLFGFSFKKINMFSFQQHHYVWKFWIIMNFFANFGRVYPLSTTSISKIKPLNHVSCVLKHLFDIYLRLLPVFSINRGVGGRGGGVKDFVMQQREVVYC